VALTRPWTWGLTIAGLMGLVLGGVAFLSGLAALVFETLWFRLAGLAFGNSVWASSIVLAGFMGGLGLGNAWAVSSGPTLRYPGRAYALLEVIVGLTGLALVFTLPGATFLFGRLFTRFAGDSVLMNPLRLLSAFGLLVIPTAAMGATIPLLIAALSQDPRRFGPSLGWLYGANTLGAVAGALLGEVFLIPRLGLRHTGLVAAGVDLVAAAAAWTRLRALPPQQTPSIERAPPAKTWSLLVAAGITGGILLALEVVWFRFLQFFTPGLALSFAVMLAVVLLGIAVGSFLAGVWLRRDQDAPLLVPPVAFAAGVTAMLGYARFEDIVAVVGVDYTPSARAIALFSFGLMGPTCVLSGMIFTLLGASLRSVVGESAKTVGALTLANTVGGTVGSLTAGFLLLPGLGVERSLALLCLTYGIAAAIVAGPTYRRGGRRRLFLSASAAAFVAALALFPFGLMKNVFIPRVVRRFAAEHPRLIATREGLTETVLYLRREEAFGVPAFRLVTNGYSMADGGLFARRYMELFAYFPLTLTEDPRSALLISYGLGMTAGALTTIPSLERIDVVDISRDVLEMGRLAYPPPSRPPLEDPRVSVHVEDGRFFLLTTRRSFDIITAEPPPPRLAGIASLYSEEYFRLLRDRLNPGGIATYWLPMSQLSPRAAHGIVRAFCDSFEDCTLWTGEGLEWMLAGTSNREGPTTPGALSRPWQNPELRRSLRSIGLEGPADILSLFIGDRETLAEWTAGDGALRDDDPALITAPGPQDAVASYLTFMDATLTRSRFGSSRFVAVHWPDSQNDATLAAFDDIASYNAAMGYTTESPSSALGERRLESLYHVLRRRRSTVLPLIVEGSEPREQDAVEAALRRGESSSPLTFRHALGLLSEHRYADAAALFSAVEAAEPGVGVVVDLKTLALCLGGDSGAAADELKARGRDPVNDPFWAKTLGGCAKNRVSPPPR
jgi:spermidine synthase